MELSRCPSTLIETPHQDAARCHPGAGADGSAYDAYTCLLYRAQADGDALWKAVRPCVRLTRGILGIDDPTLDTLYARFISLVTRHWSGKHCRVVQGINLISLVWIDGNAHFPCDFCLYDKPHDGLSKNDHFQAMILAAAERGFHPRLVVVDSWYASLDNLKEGSPLAGLALADPVQIQPAGRSGRIR